MPAHGVKVALAVLRPSAGSPGGSKAYVPPAGAVAYCVASAVPSPSKSTAIVPALFTVTSNHGRGTFVMSSLCE